MHLYQEILGALWIILLLFWLVNAFFAKRTVSHSYGIVILRILMSVVVVVALSDHSTSVFLRSSMPTFSPNVQLIGLVVCALGVALAIWARVYLGTNWGMPMSVRENPELVTTGPYAYIRNPIYTGFLLAMLGSAFVIGFFLWLGVLVFMGTYFIYSSYKEESIMLREFPDTYPSYKARTKMLIPFIF